MKKGIVDGREKAGKMFVFRVALSFNKKIWRDIAVRGDQTLDDLHEAIYDAFDRYDEHLYSFYFGQKRRKYDVEYTHHHIFEEDNPLRDLGFHRRPVYDASKANIESLGLKEKDRFWYLFDFGDCWEHVITVQKVGSAEKGSRYPLIVESKGKSPPQYPEVDDE